MRFKLFWGHISDEWMVSDQAAIVFGVAATLFSLVTAYLFGIVKIPTSGVGYGIANVIAVLGVFSAPFLWSGMMKYLEMRERATGNRFKILRLAFIIGFWFTAIPYYLLAYLPSRNELPVSASSGSWPPPPRPLGKSRKGMRAFCYVLYAGWGSLAIIVVCVFAFQNGYKLVRPVADYFVLFPCTLLILTGIYRILHFVSGEPRSRI